MNIDVNITNKHCAVQGAPVIVCGNSDYTMTFTFDAEWDNAGEKTARFSYIRDGVRRYQDVKLEGDKVAVPPVYGTKGLQVGVYSGDLVTSTPGRIPCEKSIICGTCTPEDLWPGTAEVLRSEMMETLTHLTEYILTLVCPKIDETARLVQCVPMRGQGLIVRVADPLPETGTEDELCCKLTVCGKNLYDKDAYPLTNTGYPNKSYGHFSRQSDNYRHSGFIPVRHLRGQTITVNYAPVGAQNPGMAFYTRRPNIADDADCKAAYCGGGTGANTKVPDNAEYMCFCVSTADASKDVQLEIGSVATEFEAYHAETHTATPEEAAGGWHPTAAGQLVNVYAHVHNVVDGNIMADGEVLEIEVEGTTDPAGMIDVLTQKINSLTSTTVAVTVAAASADDGGAGA